MNSDVCNCTYSYYPKAQILKTKHNKLTINVSKDKISMRLLISKDVFSVTRETSLLSGDTSFVQEVKNNDKITNTIFLSFLQYRLGIA